MTHCLHIETLNAPTVWHVSRLYPLHMAELWHIAGFLQLDKDQHCPALAPKFRQTLQHALANGKRRPSSWTNMVKDYLEVLLPFML